MPINSGILGSGVLGNGILGFAGSESVLLAECPQLKVYAAFGQNPFAASYTWTDITAYALSYNKRSGRQHELSRFESATCSILLDNTDGRFSPYNTLGPYSTGSQAGLLGKGLLGAGMLGGGGTTPSAVVPRTPIKVDAVYNGVAYPRFFGYADSWVLQWVGPGYSNVQLNCTDGLKLLSAFEFGQAAATSPYASLISADGGTNLKVYWRCGDLPGSYLSDSSGNGNNVSPVPAGFGQPGAMVYDADTSLDLTAGSGQPGGGFTWSGTVSASGITFETWFQWKTQSTPTNVAAIAQWNAGNSNTYVSLYVDLNGRVCANINTTVSSTTPTIQTTTDIRDGKWHHLVFTATSSAQTLYLDGASAGTATSTLGPQIASFGLSYFNVNASPSFLGFPANIDEVALYATSLSAATVLNHYNTGAMFRVQELSGARILHCLAQVPVPAASYNVATGLAKLAGESNSLVGTKMLSYINSVDASEAGGFWQTPAGVLMFVDRQYALSQSTSAATFSDDPTVPGINYELGSPDLMEDDIDLWTTISCQRTGGTSQVASDSSKFARFGPSQYNISGLLYSDDQQSLSLAQWYLATYKNPLLRVAGIEVTLLSQDGSGTVGGAQVANVLNLGFMQRVTVRKRTFDAGVAFQQDALIEGIEEIVTWGQNPQYTVRLRLSPYELVVGPIFTLDDPVLGKLDSGNLLAL